MEVTRFLQRQANWCYQLAWQCFDLTVAHELNAMGNELRARAREPRWTRRNAGRAELDT
jgi:hypothetical protein